MSLIEKYARIPRFTKQDYIDAENRLSTQFSREGCAEGYFKLITKHSDGSFTTKIEADSDYDHFRFNRK